MGQCQTRLEALSPGVVGFHIDGNGDSERLVVLVENEFDADLTAEIAIVMGDLPYEVRRKYGVFYGGS